MGKLIRAIGLMSGTSMDGIDVALLDTDGQFEIKVGPFATYPYSDDFRRQLKAGVLEAAKIFGSDDAGKPKVDRLARPGRLRLIEQYLTDLHIEVVDQFLFDYGVERDSVDLIGFHGHTVVHRPEMYLTVQIGDGSRLAQETGLDVVYDMRAHDCASGGVGAPLASAYHRALAARRGLPLAVLNVGGVANVTVIWGLESELEFAGFDTGPGNALVDDWIEGHTAEPFDQDGAWAEKGQVHEDLVKEMLRHPYFDRAPPKALDRNDFDSALVEGLSIEDGAATLMAFSARAVKRGLEFLSQEPKMWIVVGGGRRNPFFIKSLAECVSGLVVPSDALGIDGDSVEAQAWAYLAVRSLNKQAITFPGTTGVDSPMTGGVLARAK